MFYIEDNLNPIERLTSQIGGVYLKDDPLIAYLEDGKVEETHHSCTFSYQQIQIKIHGNFHSGGVDCGTGKPMYSATIPMRTSSKINIYPRDKLSRMWTNLNRMDMSDLDRLYKVSDTRLSKKIASNQDVELILNSIPMHIFTKQLEGETLVNMHSEKKYLTFEELLLLVHLCKKMVDIAS